MIIISYDICDDKKRTTFSKYLSKFGHRIQYSVFQIDNSKKVLDNIMVDIQNKFEPSFDESDSIYIFKVMDNNIIKYGYALHEDTDLIII